MRSSRIQIAETIWLAKKTLRGADNVRERIKGALILEMIEGRVSDLIETSHQYY